MARTLLRGQALRTFDVKATARGGETNQHFMQVINDMTTTIFPTKALQKQKRHMHRSCRKPHDMTVWQFITALQDMDTDLHYFPGATADEHLPEDKMMDIAEYGSPNSWQHQLLIQGLDVMEHTLQELVKFFERLETTEDIFEDTHQKCNANSNSETKSNATHKEGEHKNETQWSVWSHDGQNNNQNASRGNRKRRAECWCALLNTNSHDNSKCKVVMAQIECMRGSWESKGNYGSNKHARFNNNEWKNHKDPPGDVNAIWEQAVETASKKVSEEAHREVEKARKTSRHSNCDSEDSDSSDSEVDSNEFRKLNIHE